MSDDSAGQRRFQCPADGHREQPEIPPRSASTISIVMPLGFQPQYRYPLIVWLHSGGDNEQQVRRIAPHISGRNYIHVGVRGVQATDVRGQQFDWPESRRATEAACRSVADAIETVTQSCSIHHQRIIVAGYESGASMACRVALAMPDLFAGVVRMGGHFPSRERLLADWKSLRRRRLPMLWQQAVDGVGADHGQLADDLQFAQSIQAKLDVRQYLSDDLMYEMVLRDIDRWCFDTIFQPSAAPSSDAVSTISDTVPIEFSNN
ncbi:MAG: phospholipase [Planctomycetota bacterium]